MPLNAATSFLGPNPFPREDPRHDSYEALVRTMNEADARNRADLLQRAATARDEELPDLLLERAVACFDLGATVLVFGLPAHRHLEICQEALAGSANRMLEWFREQMVWRRHWGGQNGAFMANLRLRIEARLAHWTAEALKQSREAENTLLPDPGIAERESASARAKRALARYPRRAEWLRGHLDARKWSVHDLERAGGPSWKTVRRMLDGARVRETALEKVRQALSSKPVGHLNPIPHD